jgi:hypothetical protein
MSGQSSRVRPPGPVYVSAWIVYLLAFYNFAVAVWLILLALRDNAPIYWEEAIPDSWLWINAILSAMLGAIYVWLGNALQDRDASARVTTLVIATINIVFGLFTFPLGLVGIVLNVILLLLLLQKQTKAYFGEAGPVI